MPENPEIKCCDKPLEFRLQQGELWQSYIPEIATCSECNTYYKRRPGSAIVHRQAGDNYICTNCNGEIILADVAHPVWDSPFAYSGFGKIKHELVPYCQNCENEPIINGIPIRVERENPFIIFNPKLSAPKK